MTFLSSEVMNVWWCFAYGGFDWGIEAGVLPFFFLFLLRSIIRSYSTRGKDCGIKGTSKSSVTTSVCKIPLVFKSLHLKL